MISLSHWGEFEIPGDLSPSDLNEVARHWLEMNKTTDFTSFGVMTAPLDFNWRVDHSVFEPPARGYNFTRDEPQLSYDAKYIHGTSV